MNYSNASLIVNPAAGNRLYRPVKEIEALLRQKVPFSTFTTKKRGDAESFAKQVGSGLIIAAGGDGTFNEIINGILSNENSSSAGIPVALIPVGTTNVLAKELGIPHDIEKAVDLALSGAPKKISLGRIVNTRHLPARPDSSLVRHFCGGTSPGRTAKRAGQAGSSLDTLNHTVQGVARYFCLMAGIGFDGETVFRVRNNIKKISGRGAYILSGIDVLRKYDPPLIQVKTSAGIFAGYTAVVGNARYYGGRFCATPKADITKPMLDLCLLKTRTRKSLLKFISGIILDRHPGFREVLYGKFTEMEISSRETVHVQTDGDYFGTLPVKIDVVKDAVSVVL